MNSLFIDATEMSPQIVFDTNKKVFEIIGESRPENVREFYEPVLIWLDEYGNELTSKNQNAGDNALVFNFKFVYFNSSSSKFILDILKKIHEFYTKGIKVTINWYFDEGDEDMQEVGEKMSKMINFPFNYVEIEE